MAPYVLLPYCAMSGLGDGGQAAGEDDDDDLQRAIELSMLGTGTGSSTVPALPRASTPEVKELLRTVVGNLVDKGRDDAKYRRINDAAVRRRCTGDAYNEATSVLSSLGFALGNEAGAPAWSFPGELEGEPLRRLIDARNEWTPSLGSSAGSTQATTPLPATVSATVPGDLRPTMLKAETPVGPLSVLAFPDAFVQLVQVQDFESFRACGSGKVRGRAYGMRADQRIMLTVCNLCPGVCVTGHWIDWTGDERMSPNVVCNAPRPETVQTYILHSFALRLSPQQQVVLCGLRVTERPHYTGGHVVVLVVSGSDPKAFDMAALASKCQQIMVQAGDDPREPPEAASRQGPPPAPPPPSHGRGKFWGS